MQPFTNKSPSETDKSSQSFRESPHLRKSLERQGFGDSALLRDAFELAVASGGLRELDFEREEGASYNPRPARVALILLDNCGVRDELTLAAGILAASDAPEAEAAETLAEAISIAKSTRCTAAALANADDRLLNIALTLQLDRARHRHQADASADSGWPEFIAETEKYIVLAQSRSHPLYQILAAWIQRAKRQH